MSAQPASPSFRGGFVVPTRICVDADGRPVPAGSPEAVRLYAPAGATITEAEAQRLGLSGSDGHVCDDCGYEARTKAGLGAHRRTHKGDG